MFFIQACRGEVPAGVSLDEISPNIPINADFIFGYATARGDAAYRDNKHGSWYISALCKELCRNSTHLHLLDMLTNVNREVATKGVQIPEPTTRLRYNVYFF